MTAPLSTRSPLRPHDLAELLEVPFTDEQLAAVCAPLEPGVVIAGAGSGKTSVMAARVVWVVAHHGVPAHEVLGLTFTNKAAGELDARIRRALRALSGASGADGRVDPLDEVDLFPTVSTYHAYAGRLVREHGLRLGVEPSSRLLADATRYQLAERVIREAEGPFPSLSRAVSTLVTDVLDLDSECSEHLVALAEVAAFDAALLESIDRVPGPTKDVLTAREQAVVRGYVLQMVQAYRDEKRRRMLADFGDQMAWASQLAETVPEVRTSERELFGVVLLDEYQDTSIAQKRLLRGLFGDGHPVTAVGDPFQAIYGWRGASVSNIDRFAEEFPGPQGPAQVFTLSRNNRSGGHQLEVANAVTGVLRDAHPHVVPLQPRPGREGDGSTAVGLFTTAAQEWTFVADDIERRWRSGTEPKDMAVLLRVSSDVPEVYGALTARDVPVEVVGLNGLLELPEVADLVATLRVLDDPTANAALLRLLVGPRWRIGARDLALLGRRARSLVETHGRGEQLSLDAGWGDAGTVIDEEPPGDLDAALLSAVAGVDPTEVVSLSEALADPGTGPYDPEALLRMRALSDELATLRRFVGEPVDDLAHRVASTLGLFVEARRRSTSCWTSPRRSSTSTPTPR
jgi:DNA helicase-2/ATP-dependent DNA helicase PcrA